MSDRLTYYRRWKLGEDPHALAKEAGVTRERMRHMLAKMDADVPLVDQLAAAEARIAELEAERDEALRRRDAWKARAENHVEIVNALRAKTAGKDSRTLSRALLGAAFAEAESRAEAAEARVKVLEDALRAGIVCTSEHGGAAKFLKIARAALGDKTDGTP